MKSEAAQPKARQYLEELASQGRHSFTSAEAKTAHGVSAHAAFLALNRLAKQGLLASPARGFYVIVPPEYRSLGCLPAEQFVPDLMKWLKRPYYVCLLSAAELHGAAHQRPQALQVFLQGKRRPTTCGRVRVDFMVRKGLSAVPVQTVNTPRGGLVVSTPEATALDLVGYERQAGGLNLVATVLSELAERVDPQKLAAAANASPIVWAQRLGYLMQLVGAGDRVGPLQRVRPGSRTGCHPTVTGSPVPHEPPRRRMEGLRERQTWKGTCDSSRLHHRVEKRGALGSRRSSGAGSRHQPRPGRDLLAIPLLQDALAFRGGTALYKLHLKPAARYSEDIDLVQTKAEAAGPMMQALRESPRSLARRAEVEADRRAGDVCLPVRFGRRPAASP